MLLLFLYMGRIPVPNKPLYDEPFRGRFDAAHPDLADAVTVPPVCQEEPYNPGRDVSINPNENSILTPYRPFPDVRLGYASTGQKQDNAGGEGPLLATRGHSE